MGARRERPGVNGNHLIGNRNCIDIMRRTQWMKKVTSLPNFMLIHFLSSSLILFRFIYFYLLGCCPDRRPFRLFLLFVLVLFLFDFTRIGCHMHTPQPNVRAEANE